MGTRKHEKSEGANEPCVADAHALAAKLLTDRHALDAVARAVVSGERGLGMAEDALADAVASLMINRLEIANSGGYARVAHLPWNIPDRRWQVEAQYGREFLNVLIRRVDKHLAHAAMITFSHGAS